VLKEVAAGISGAVNTAAAGISTADAITSVDGNSAMNNPTTADVSPAPGIPADGISGAAGISTAAVGTVAMDIGEESPLSVEGSRDEANEINLARLKVSGIEDITSGTEGGGVMNGTLSGIEDITSGAEGGGVMNGTSSKDDEHRKRLINLSKTRKSCSCSCSCFCNRL